MKETKANSHRLWWLFCLKKTEGKVKAKARLYGSFAAFSSQLETTAAFAHPADTGGVVVGIGEDVQAEKKRFCGKVRDCHPLAKPLLQALHDFLSSSINHLVHSFLKMAKAKTDIIHGKGGCQRKPCEAAAGDEQHANEPRA
ncbi:hypothetical protein P4V39_07275 [Brevibacillus borstelensis]|uniref:hypothetical protein n=1 Tax=Brevibacillus TaxID=55080 RepID=UPI002E1D541D|nr:hypothetical protein [Brevibacillus borstelensis]